MAADSGTCSASGLVMRAASTYRSPRRARVATAKRSVTRLACLTPTAAAISSTTPVGSPSSTRTGHRGPWSPCPRLPGRPGGALWANSLVMPAGLVRRRTLVRGASPRFARFRGSRERRRPHRARASTPAGHPSPRGGGLRPRRPRRRRWLTARGRGAAGGATRSRRAFRGSRTPRAVSGTRAPRAARRLCPSRRRVALSLPTAARPSAARRRSSARRSRARRSRGRRSCSRRSPVVHR